AALHQHLRAALAYELDGTGRARLAVRGVLDLVTVDVELEIFRDPANTFGRPHEDRLQNAGSRRVDGRAHRDVVARMRDGGRDRRHVLAAGEHPLVLAGATCLGHACLPRDSAPAGSIKIDSTRARRSLRAVLSSPVADRTLRTMSITASRSACVGRSFGSDASACFSSRSSMKNWSLNSVRRSAPDSRRPAKSSACSSRTRVSILNPRVSTVPSSAPA